MLRAGWTCGAARHAHHVLTAEAAAPDLALFLRRRVLPTRRATSETTCHPRRVAELGPALPPAQQQQQQQWAGRAIRNRLSSSGWGTSCTCGTAPRSQRTRMRTPTTIWTSSHAHADLLFFMLIGHALAGCNNRVKCSSQDSERHGLAHCCENSIHVGVHGRQLYWAGGEAWPT